MVTEIDSFIAKKKSDSEYLTLDAGESVKVLKLVEIKVVNKAGFSGQEEDFLRLVCEVDTEYGIRTKKFDNKTNRFAQHLSEMGVKVGSSFKLTRFGLNAKTRYEISDYIAPASESPV